jgi:radical SAM protein with 4Fe4S-binding SPASM domain
MLRDLELRLDITNCCNLHCIMCHWYYDGSSSHTMSLDEFKQATEGILRRVNVLFLSWTAEPLLNKELPAIIAYARRSKVPCITLVTNLTMLTEEIADAFVNNGLHRINVSIDAADPKLYAVIRQQDRFAKVIENLRRIQQLKKKRRSRFPIIALNTVLLKMNIAQLNPLIDLCANLEITELNCSTISIPKRYDDRNTRFEFKGLPPDFNLHDEMIDLTDDSVKKNLASALRYAQSKGIVFTIANRFDILSKRGIPRRIELARFAIRKMGHFPFRSIAYSGLSYAKNFFTMSRVFCSYPWRQLVVTAKGEVGPCCMANETLSLGKMSDAPLADIWKGEALKKIRDQLSKGTPPELCRTCVRGRSKTRHGF